MIVNRALTLLLLPLILPAAHADGLKFIHNWRDVQLYLKPKYDLVRTFDQEFGIVATVAQDGNFREAVNFCYDPTYPIRLNQKPHYAIGAQTTYIFMHSKQLPGIYTKIKSNFVGVWKEESGFTARVFTSPRVIVSANLAWLFTYPYKSSAKPQWLALVNFQFPLG
ncbi:MAG: hypothetical protein ACYC96_15710 [Fimbriimonadaceae bacterium]